MDLVVLHWGQLQHTPSEPAEALFLSLMGMAHLKYQKHFLSEILSQLILASSIVNKLVARA